MDGTARFFDKLGDKLASRQVAQRQILAEQLEQARLDKQAATPRSEQWYDADSRIERISKALYDGRTIDMEQVLDEEVES